MTGDGEDTWAAAEPLSSEEWAEAFARAEAEGSWDESFVLRANAPGPRLEEDDHNDRQGEHDNEHDNNERTAA